MVHILLLHNELYPNAMAGHRHVITAGEQRSHCVTMDIPQSTQHASDINSPRRSCLSSELRLSCELLLWLSTEPTVEVARLMECRRSNEER